MGFDYEDPAARGKRDRSLPAKASIRIGFHPKLALALKLGAKLGAAGFFKKALRGSRPGLGRTLPISDDITLVSAAYDPPQEHTTSPEKVMPIQFGSVSSSESAGIIRQPTAQTCRSSWRVS